MFRFTNQEKKKSMKINIENQPSNNYQNRKNILFGITTLAAGIFLLFTKTILTEYITTSFFALTPNSILKELWIKSPVPVATEVYLFNWTNPEEFNDISIKPKLKEVGPYRFMQYIEKVNLIWNTNDTVTFKQVKSFYYDDQNSNFDVSDQVIVFNFITSMISATIQDWNIVLKKGASLLIDAVSPEIYLTKTAKEYIYDGLDNFFIHFGNTFPFIFNHVPRFEKIGVLSISNASIDFDGTFNMATGVNGDFSIQRWNHHNKTSYFKGSCAKVSGTLGELFGRRLSKDHIVLFVPDMCRYVKLDFTKEVMVSGILGYKYSIGRSIMDNGSIVAENKCFCGTQCIPSGMISMSSCRWGLPAYISLPHFYQADSVYLEAVDGLEPQEHKHEGYIIVEPITGVPLKVSVGMQFNTLVQPVEGITLYEDVRKIFFPLCWIKQSVTLPNMWLLALKIYLYLPWILVGFDLALIFLGFYLLLRPMFKIVLIHKGWYTQLRRNITRKKSSPAEPLLVINR